MTFTPEQLKTIEEKVRKLLQEKPKLRYNRRELEWEYWKKYDGLVFGITKEMWFNQGKQGGLTKYSALDRAIRKVFQDNPHLRSAPDANNKRYEQAREWQTFYGEKKNKD